jgi:hypothetical protein
MKDVIFLIFHLVTTMAKLLQSGGSRAIIAEKMRPQPVALDEPDANPPTPNPSTASPASSRQVRRV